MWMRRWIYGRRGHSSLRMRDSALALILASMIVWGCEDEGVGRPEPEFFADIAFGVLPPAAGQPPPSELWAASLDGRFRRLTRDPACFATSPTISPDGRWVAFQGCGSAANGGAPDIFVAKADTNVLRNLTGSQEAEEHPRWSPDGKRIAFEKIGGGFRDVIVAELRESTFVAVTASDAVFRLGEWSPDAAALVLEHAAGDPTVTQILVISLPTLARRAVTSGPGLKRGPVWAPAADSIAYLRDARLVLADAAGKGEREIAVVQDSLIPPLQWSQDGLSILATSVRSGRRDVVRISRHGGAIQDLTGRYQPGSEPALLWGRHEIAYVADLGFHRKIYLIDTDGFGNRPLTQFTVNEFGPVTRRPSHSQGH